MKMTCDFCGKETECSNLFIQNAIEPNMPIRHQICHDCLNKYIYANLTTKDPNVKPADAFSKSMIKPDNTTAFAGMLLRDFLRTPFYLEDLGTIYTFVTPDDKEIIDLQPWLLQPIATVSNKTEHSEIFVTLADNKTDSDDENTTNN
jgi:hypothetical protein